MLNLTAPTPNGMRKFCASVFLGFILPRAVRIYPRDHTAAHILGHVDTENNGIADIENPCTASWPEVKMLPYQSILASNR